MSYIGKYADRGSKNSFYTVKGQKYGFKSFPNKSLADFAHAVQSHLAPYCAPKVYSPVCKIRIPNYFVDGMKKNKIQYRTEMILSDWGYLTEIAKSYTCLTPSCDGDCANCGSCNNYYAIQELLSDMEDCGVEYVDAHKNNLGYVIRNKHKILVAIDFGRESVGEVDESFPEVCWDGDPDSECYCDACVAKYGKVDEYA